MNQKSRELVQLVIKIQNQFCNIYKNVSVIGGKYDVHLQSAAKVLSSHLKDRTEYYNEILVEAADESDETTEENYELVKEAILRLKEQLGSQTFTSVASFINYAVKHTDILIGIADVIIERIKLSENNYESMEKTLIEIREKELETKEVLASFIRKSKDVVE